MSYSSNQVESILISAQRITDSCGAEKKKASGWTKNSRHMILEQVDQQYS